MQKLNKDCQLILISGGARSGKSRTALEMARNKGEQRLFIATAQAFDEEMKLRIAAHRIERPDFISLEKPLALADGFDSSRVWDVIVIDCLTLWLSNLLLSDRTDAESEASVEKDLLLLSSYARHLIIVSNEVGLGIVPEHALARRFRDVNGRLQQRIAALSGEVYFTVMGCVLPLHALALRQREL